LYQQNNDVLIRKTKRPKSIINIQSILENPNPNRKTRILIRTLKNLYPRIRKNPTAIHHP